MRPFLQSITICLIAASLVSCAGNATLSPEDMQATAAQLAATGIVLTQQSIPTSTPLPTATATNTPLPSPTATETLAPTPAVSKTPLPTATLELPTATDAPYAPPGQSAPLLLRNNSGESVLLIFLSPTYQEYNFTSTLKLTVPWGTYTYRAWIDNEGPFVGSFNITNKDKHTLVFETDKVHFLSP